MICRFCNVHMDSGTEYKKEGTGYRASRYDECPKCHIKRYNKGENIQLPAIVIKIDKKKPMKH